MKLGTTAAQKKLFFNLRRAKAQMKAIEDGDLKPESVKKIAQELNVTEDEVVSMNRRLAGPDHSLNAPLRTDGEGGGEWQDWLVDDRENQEVLLGESQELKDRQKMLSKAMDVLNPREKRILQERRLKDDPATLEDLSSEFNISRERVRQIEVRAFEKLQKSMRKMANARPGA